MKAHTTSIPTNSNPNCEIVTERVVNAPQQLAFQAWADPDHLKIWWGPAGFTNTFHEFDFREGGKWSFVMHGPEKGHYQNECEFTRIEAPSLIMWKRYSNPLFRVSVTFEALDEKRTRVVFKQIFDTETECQKLKPYVVDKNEEVFDRLEVELIRMEGSK